MAKYYRFMSWREFNSLARGDKLTNNSQFVGKKTDSEGFCFLGEKTEFFCGGEEYPHKSTYNAIQCYRFLSSIVSDDVLVEFETDINLKEGSGVYADPESDYFYDCIEIQEYSIMEYSRETMTPKKYCVDFTWESKYFHLSDHVTYAGSYSVENNDPYKNEKAGWYDFN